MTAMNSLQSFIYLYSIVKFSIQLKPLPLFFAFLSFLDVGY